MVGVMGALGAVGRGPPSEVSPGSPPGGEVLGFVPLPHFLLPGGRPLTLAHFLINTNVSTRRAAAGPRPTRLHFPKNHDPRSSLWLRC